MAILPSFQDCDDANEAELQGRVEALRRKERSAGVRCW